jgi:cytochrome P450
VDSILKIAVDEAESTRLDGLDVSRPERFATDTHGPFFARLRREAPVHFCPESAYGPYWSVTRYDDVVAVGSDHARFSSYGNVIIGDVPPEFDATRAFATTDPPEHTRERKAVMAAVSLKRMGTIEDGIRRHVASVLDGLPRGEPFDWVERLSVEMTTQMIATLFDLPPEERRLLPYWCEVLVTTPAPDALVTTWKERDEVLERFREHLLALWRARASSPKEDILSALTQNPDTRGMADEPARLLGTVALIAGANEAARGALSGAVVAFHRFPGEWAALQASPALIPGAVSEIVRWQTPILHMRRTATEDVELRGQRIRKGDRVVMWYCSGNRDEKYFEDGDALRIARPGAHRHLSYGFGVHHCLGRPGAELQLRVLLDEMRKRFDRVELVGEPRRRASNFSGSYDALWVEIPP